MRLFAPAVCTSAELSTLMLPADDDDDGNTVQHSADFDYYFAKVLPHPQ